jgi:hypothetical protein
MSVRDEAETKFPLGHVSPRMLRTYGDGRAKIFALSLRTLIQSNPWSPLTAASSFNYYGNVLKRHITSPINNRSRHPKI